MSFASGQQENCVLQLLESKWGYVIDSDSGSFGRSYVGVYTALKYTTGSSTLPVFCHYLSGRKKLNKRPWKI